MLERRILTDYYNTIDLDKIDKEQLERIISKIKTNPCLKNIQVKDSSTKGYHLLLTCNRKCDICRIVFDDQKRLEMDNNRPLKLQNTLFTSKEPVQGNLKYLSQTCDRCAKYGKIVNLKPIELSGDEMVHKLDVGKMKKPYVVFGHEIAQLKTAFIFGYQYLECPECKWFKFIKKKGV